MPLGPQTHRGLRLDSFVQAGLVWVEQRNHVVGHQGRGRADRCRATWRIDVTEPDTAHKPSDTLESSMKTLKCQHPPNASYCELVKIDWKYFKTDE